MRRLRWGVGECALKRCCRLGDLGSRRHGRTRSNVRVRSCLSVCLKAGRPGGYRVGARVCVGRLHRRETVDASRRRHRCRRAINDTGAWSGLHAPGNSFLLQHLLREGIDDRQPSSAGSYVYILPQPWSGSFQQEVGRARELREYCRRVASRCWSRVERFDEMRRGLTVGIPVRRVERWGDERGYI